VADDVHQVSDAAAGPRRGNAFGGLLKELTIIIVGALVISTILRVFVAQMFIIPSGSMENTLQVSDRVLVQKVTHFARGDVVVFSDPGGWLSETPTIERGVVGDVLVFIGLMPDESTGHLIKRVIGLPGDKVSCCDATGRVTVNGQALDEAPYLYEDVAGQVAPSDFSFSVTVPAGHIFVMGDHRNNSRDSRCHLRDPGTNGEPTGSAAFVPESDVVGTAVWIVFPFSRWAGLSQPKTFTSVPDPPAAPAQAVISNSGPGC
jgi:signal peptidase I